MAKNAFHFWQAQKGVLHLVPDHSMLKHQSRVQRL